MGYGYYTLPDGREAGYGVAAECDKDGCTERIDRGLAFLCGNDPDGWRDSEEPGCGNYYCSEHQGNHDCPDPACGKYSEDGNLYCARRAGHDSPHYDEASDEPFERTEEDEEDDGAES